MTGGTDHTADDALTSARDAGPPSPALVDEIETALGDPAGDAEASEPTSSEGDAVDAGPPPAALVDDVEESPADATAGDGTSRQSSSEGDAIDAGPPPADLGEEVESLDDA